MEKRTLIFVISLSLTLFLTNIFFESFNGQNRQEWRRKQLAKQAKKLDQIEKKLQSLAVIPVSSIFGDAQLQKSLGTAHLSGNTLFPLPSTRQLPSQVYTRSAETGQVLTFNRLASDALGTQKVDLYQLSGSPTPTIDLEPIHRQGSYDFLLVYSKDQKTHETIGEIRNGKLNLPIQTLVKARPDKWKEEAPSGNALAFRKINGKILPIGIYRSDKDEIVSFHQMIALSPYFKILQPQIVAQKGSTEEQFYVLENDYQQLVFSTRGGALVELNLSLQSENQPKSFVKKIETDRDILAQSPENDYFPMRPFVAIDEKTGAKVNRQEGVLGGYYPLLRRDIVSHHHKVSKLSPQFYALNVVSQYPEVANLNYQVTHFDENSITFQASQPHRKITKTFSLPKDSDQAPYCIDLVVSVEGDSRGLWITSGVPELDRPASSVTPALKYRITRGQTADVESISLPKETYTLSSASPDWICNSNGFLGLIIDPLTKVDAGFRVIPISGTELPSRLTLIDQQYNRYQAKDLPGYAMLIPLSSKGGEMHFRFFGGPFAENVLTTIDQHFSDPATGYNPDYISCQSYHGWFAFISRPFAKFLFFLLRVFHGLTNSWGFSIILLTVALRLMLYPLNSWSMRSMMNMQKIAPEVTAIQKRFGKDSKKMQLEIANLYREKGVNPFSGCLPMLIQMPFLFGMFDLLRSSFELRGASFIPGWIDNLAAPDVLFQWNYPIYFIGNEFHLLPLLLGGVMFLQQKLSSTAPADANAMTDQQRQQRAMATVMPVLFTVMFYNFPSGLNIYWFSSTLIGIAQQWWMKKRSESETVQILAPKKKR